MDRVHDLKEVAEVEGTSEDGVGSGETVDEGSADTHEATKGFQLFGVIASIFSSEEVDDIIERFTEVTGKFAFVNRKRGGDREHRDQRESKSGIDGRIVVWEGRATRRVGRSHEEEPKKLRRG